jgi:hypothetical protein
LKFALPELGCSKFSVSQVIAFRNWTNFAVLVCLAKDLSTCDLGPH